jgi:glycosyltransferase involved in cell wall biosynthesis
MAPTSDARLPETLPRFHGGMPNVLVAHPAADLYGSDRQMVRVVEGLSVAGWDVTVHLPDDGPLLALLEPLPNVTTRCTQFSVLRKALLRPHRLLALAFSVLRDIARLVRVIRAAQPDVVYVNTVTIPWWILAARLCRRPVLVHVREAEQGTGRAVSTALTAPLRLADAVVTNSLASRRVLVDAQPRLAGRATVVYNGVRGPAAAGGIRPTVARGSGSPRLVLVGRLSPRKGTDVALEAVARLREQGRDVTIDICGTVYSGYEWFGDQLHERAGRDDLAGAVRFHGYVNPTWPLLDAADVVLVPSRAEPFGNTAVEGLLARRPVVATAVQGLVEIIADGQTGLLVPADDPVALAAAVARLLDDPALADRLAEHGYDEAVRRFSVGRYQRDLIEQLTALIGGPPAPAARGARPGEYVREANSGGL